MIAYLGDPNLKAQTLAMIEAHRQADELAKGAYVKTNGKTTYCAVGCVLKDPHGGHSRYETEFGIPAQLAYLEDPIFEALPDERALTWPGEFMAAIGVGADLAPVWSRFAAWMMTDPHWGIAATTKVEDVKAVCERVADAYLRIAAGQTIAEADAQAITADPHTAWDPPRAAWAARDAWDAEAAHTAWAAWAAWAERAAWAARDARVVASADQLLGLLNSSEAQ